MAAIAQETQSNGLPENQTRSEQAEEKLKIPRATELEKEYQEQLQKFLPKAKELLSDLEFTDEEIKALEVLTTPLREFEKQSETHGFAAYRATLSVAEKSGMTPSEISVLVWAGDSVVTSSDSGSLLEKPQESLSKYPYTVSRINAMATMAAGERILVAGEAFKNHEEVAKLHDSRELFLAAAKSGASDAIKNYPNFKALPFSDEILEIAINSNPLQLLETPEVIKGHPKEEHYLRAAITRQAEIAPWYLLDKAEELLKRFPGDMQLQETLELAAEKNPVRAVEKFEQISSLPKAEEILERCFRTLSRTNPWYVLSEQVEKLEGKAYATEIVAEAAKGYPSQALESFAKFKDFIPSANDILRGAASEILESNPSLLLTNEKTLTQALGEEESLALRTKALEAILKNSPASVLSYKKEISDLETAESSLLAAADWALEHQPSRLLRGIEALEGLSRDGKELMPEMSLAAAKKLELGVSEFHDWEIEFAIENVIKHTDGEAKEELLRLVQQKAPYMLEKLESEFRNEPYAAELYETLASKAPEKFVRSFHQFKDLDNSEALLKTALENWAKIDSYEVAAYIERQRGTFRFSENERVFLDFERNELPKIVPPTIDDTDFLKDLSGYKKKMQPELFEKRLRSLVDSSPIPIIQTIAGMREVINLDPKLAGELAEAVMYRQPYSLIESLELPRSPEIWGEKPLSLPPELYRAHMIANQFVTYAEQIKEPGLVYAQRVERCEQMIKSIFGESGAQKFELALDEMEQRHGVVLRLRGVSRDPASMRGINLDEARLVLVNEFANTNTGELARDLKPMALALNPGELIEAIKSDRILEVLEEKYNEELNSKSKQRELWDRAGESSADIQVAKDPGVTLAAITRGISHRDMLRLAHNYHLDGVNIQAVFTESSEQDTWTSAMKMRGLDIPIKGSSLKDLNTGLPQQISEAILDGRDAWRFHYKIHGSSEGGILLSNSQTLEAEKFAELISKPFENPNDVGDPRNGQPLCSLIPIHLTMESCHASYQGDDIVKTLKENGTAVKDLYMTMSSGPEIAIWGMPPGEALDTEYTSGKEDARFQHYMLSYREMLDYLKGKGISTEGALGTRMHQEQFSDRMTQFWDTQDVHIRRYSTEKNKDELLSDFRQTNIDSLPA